MEQVKEELLRTDTSKLLKHLSKEDEKSGKNVSGLVKASDDKSPFATKIPQGKKRLERVGDSWHVEFHSDEKKVIVDVGGMRETVMVRDCYNSVIKIGKKVKAVLIENCVKTNFVIDSVVSSIEVVGCEKIKIQITGFANSMSIDKTSGIDIYISKESKKSMMIATSKSGGMNLNFPSDSDSADGDWVECPIPEQYEHKISGNKIVTEVSSLYSC